MVFRFALDWATPGARPGRTILHAQELQDVEDFLANFQDAWTGIKVNFVQQASWRFDGEVVLLDTATGVLQSAATIPSVAAQSGTAQGDVVANSAQVLIRWASHAVVNGRRMAGRSFLPGLAVGATLDGEITPALVGGMAGALRAAGVPATLAVWHRPQNGAGGSLHAVNDCTVWNELAVLRRRR